MSIEAIQNLHRFKRKQLYPGDILQHHPGQPKADLCLFCKNPLGSGDESTQGFLLSLINRKGQKRYRLHAKNSEFDFHYVKVCQTCFRKTERRYVDGFYIIGDVARYVLQGTAKISNLGRCEGGLEEGICFFCGVPNSPPDPGTRFPRGNANLLVPPLCVCEDCQKGKESLLQGPIVPFRWNKLPCHTCSNDILLSDLEIASLRDKGNVPLVICDSCAIAAYSGEVKPIPRFLNTVCSECEETDMVIDRGLYSDNSESLVCRNCLSQTYDVFVGDDNKLVGRAIFKNINNGLTDIVLLNLNNKVLDRAKNVKILDAFSLMRKLVFSQFTNRHFDDVKITFYGRQDHSEEE